MSLVADKFTNNLKITVMKTTNQFFTISKQDILPCVQNSFIKNVGHIYVSIDFSPDIISVNGTPHNISECSVIVTCDMGYTYTKTFYGKDCIDKCINFANNRLNDKYLTA